MALSQPPITLDDVRSLFGSTIYARGREYFTSGLVVSAAVHGDTLVGEVQGTQPEPYQVSVKLALGGLTADCDCPHEALLCKHVCALLINWLEEPESFEVAGGEETPPGDPSSVVHLGDGPSPVPVGEPTRFDPQKARAKLVEQLGRRLLGDLRALARKQGIALSGKNKDRLVDELAALLTDPERVRARVRSLGSDERLILDVVQVAGGAEGLGLERIQSRLQAFGLDGLAAKAPDVADGLGEQWLLATRDGGLWNQWMKTSARLSDAAQAELFAYSTSYLLKPPACPVEELRVAARSKPLDEDLFLVWSYLAQNELEPPPMREQSEAEWRDGLRGWANSPDEIAALEINPRQTISPWFSLAVLSQSPPLAERNVADLARLISGDRDEVLLLYHVLKKLGLIEDNKDSLVAHREKMVDYLRLSRGERLQAAAQAWLKPGRWDESFFIDGLPRGLQVRRLVGSRYLKAAEFRRELADGQCFVASFLARLDANRWHSCASLLEALHALRPDFLVRPLATLGNRLPWWFQALEKGRQLDPNNWDDWLQAEGSFVLGILRGPLLRLGVVELGYVGDRLDSFRTTPLSPILIGLIPPAAKAAPPPPIEVGADLMVFVAPGAADPEANHLLSRLGILDHVEPARFGYRLSPEKVARAFEEGRSVDDIVDFFRRRSAHLPRELVQALHGWWTSYGQIRLYRNLTIVEFADDYVLRELRASTSIAQHIVFEFSPRVVALLPGSVERLMAEITRKGYTPKMAEGTV